MAITFTLSNEDLSRWSNKELIEQVHIFHNQLFVTGDMHESILIDTMSEIYDALLVECARRLEALTN